MNKKIPIYNQPLTVVSVLFCSLTKGITPKICRLYVYVVINKRSFEPLICLDLSYFITGGENTRIETREQADSDI